ncbi:acyltransferase domain-containing protein, partial [Lysinibacillus sp. NPDC056185]|uniref:acyltransferase domain-containing protein n=1 Tax=Lysinibacillus sp. NPDC056185 TaxID=3345739 RepID=UPI0039EE74F8
AAGSTARQSIPIGSVKTNIGHLGAAAGVPGLIKTVLALKHRKLPASLHYKKPNPRIDFAETPFHVARRARTWPKRKGLLRAGVSSFGIGGTNAHLILEEAGETSPAGPGRPWQVLPLSAKTPTALAVMREQLAAHLAAGDSPADCPDDLADAAHTLQVGRPQLAHRTYAVCPLAGGEPTFTEPVQVKPGKPEPVVFLFPGQGAQYLDMAAQAYDSEAVFRAAFDECAELAAPLLGADLREVVFARATADEEAQALAERLQRTAFTQPALFAVEYALARLWLSWGVQPEAMVGHSIGEIVAACLADVFSLPAAVEFVVTRGRLVQSMPTGAMLAVPLTEEELEPLLGDETGLAAVNGPRAAVVAGPHAAIEALRASLEHAGVQATELRTSHAFHSAMLDPVVAPLREAAERAGLKPPSRRFVSTVTGDWITDQEA